MARWDVSLITERKPIPRKKECALGTDAPAFSITEYNLPRHGVDREMRIAWARSVQIVASFPFDPLTALERPDPQTVAGQEGGREVLLIRNPRRHPELHALRRKTGPDRVSGRHVVWH